MPLKDLNQMFKDLSVGDGDDDIKKVIVDLNSVQANVVSLIL